MMGATVVDVIGRHLFGAPLQGVVEIVEISMVAATFLGIAAASFAGAHIVVDLVDTAMPRAAAAIAALASAASLLIFAALAWLTTRELLDAIDWGDTTVDLGIPHTAYWAFILAGFAFGTVAALLRLLSGAHR